MLEGLVQSRSKNVDVASNSVSAMLKNTKNHQKGTLNRSLHDRWRYVSTLHRRTRWNEGINDEFWGGTRRTSAPAMVSRPYIPLGIAYRERNEHVARTRSGAACCTMMCRAEDVTSAPRKVLSFDHDDVFVGGAWIDLYGEVWIEMTSRIPASTLQVA